MTTSRLKALTRKWVTDLRLNDWSLTVELLKDKSELDDCDGMAQWQTEYKKVDIILAGGQSDVELEETLVHELLHIRLEAHKGATKTPKYDAMYEHGLNVLARVLVAQRRRTKTPA